MRAWDSRLQPDRLPLFIKRERAVGRFLKGLTGCGLNPTVASRNRICSKSMHSFGASVKVHLPEVVQVIDMEEVISNGPICLSGLTAYVLFTVSFDGA